jgi:peptidoglycan/xylan/chitin deacetylase (PgdA/CDA1 family)
LSLSHDFAPQFALPRGAQSRAARALGKLSRFAARSIATKTVRMTNEKPLVSFTFDDAPESACTTGAALLEKHKARGTYYISGAGCGTAGFCGRLATAEDVKALAARGHEIGCHTHSHVAVARVGRQKLAAELLRNGAFLQAVQSIPTLYNFAYPYGEFSLATKLYLQRQFASCRSLLPGVNIGNADLGALPRLLPRRYATTAGLFSRPTTLPPSRAASASRLVFSALRLRRPARRVAISRVSAMRF